jgi:hypothetical protein
MREGSISPPSFSEPTRTIRRQQWENETVLARRRTLLAPKADVVESEGESSRLKGRGGKQLEELKSGANSAVIAAVKAAQHLKAREPSDLTPQITHYRDPIPYSNYFKPWSNPSVSLLAFGRSTTPDP